MSSGGYVATTVLPPASAAVAVTEQIGTSAPAGITPLARARRTLDGSSTVLIYLEFTAATPVTFAGSLGVSIALPGAVTGASYYLAVADGSTTFVQPGIGPGTVSGSTVSFPLASGSTTTIAPGAPLVYALYLETPVASPSPSASASASPSPSASAVASPSPSAAASASPSPAPSPSPSPSPMPTPTPVPAVSPATLMFDATAPTSAPFTVTETGNTAAFSASITCAAGSPPPSPAPSGMFVAELAATSATPVAGVATFTVISGDEYGVCTIVVSDANGASTDVTVDVNQTNLGIEGKRRAKARGAHG